MSQETPIGNLGGGISDEDSKLVDSILNEAISLGYNVNNFEVDHYICWGTPDDLKTYRYWQNFFNTVNWHPYDYRKDYLTH